MNAWKQADISDVLRMQERDRIAREASVFVTALQLDGRKCNEMDAGSYKRHKANLMRSLRGVPLR